MALAALLGHARRRGPRRSRPTHGVAERGHEGARHRRVKGRHGLQSAGQRDRVAAVTLLLERGAAVETDNVSLLRHVMFEAQYQRLLNDGERQAQDGLFAIRIPSSDGGGDANWVRKGGLSPTLATTTPGPTLPGLRCLTMLAAGVDPRLAASLIDHGADVNRMIGGRTCLLEAIAETSTWCSSCWADIALYTSYRSISRWAPKKKDGRGTIPPAEPYYAAPRPPPIIARSPSLRRRAWNVRTVTTTICHPAPPQKRKDAAHHSAEPPPRLARRLELPQPIPDDDLPPTNLIQDV